MMDLLISFYLHLIAVTTDPATWVFMAQLAVWRRFLGEKGTGDRWIKFGCFALILAPVLWASGLSWLGSAIATACLVLWFTWKHDNGKWHVFRYLWAGLLYLVLRNRTTWLFGWTVWSELWLGALSAHGFLLLLEVFT